MIDYVKKELFII